jgi:N-acetylglucosamine-6-phosphate deacetylase
MLLAADSVLLPGADEATPGWIETSGERIAATGVGAPPREPDDRLDGVVAPGFVDVHSHGGGGASFVTLDPDEVQTALAAHAAVGTTTMVTSLVTGALPDLVDQVRMLRGLWEDGRIAGVHLEGPWLAPERKGAHPRHLLADPDPESVRMLLDAGGGAVRMVTIAPERAGAIQAVRLLAEAGVVAAVGHTAADFDTAVAAIEAGVVGATHLFNAMPPMLHRAPGPVLALWRDQRVVLEIVLDGVHVRPELAAFAFASSPGRVALVTDAMAAAGAPDGDYRLGELDVVVRDRVARLAGSDTIAGSTLTLDRAVRNAVAAGVPLAAAVQAATEVPADYLGLAGVGRLQPGCYADLVLLDDGLEVRAVMRRGTWIVGG